jgi:hypothetical protein
MMLSLNEPKSEGKGANKPLGAIALVNPSKDKNTRQKFNEIYLVEDDDDLEPIETTDGNKRKIFKSFLDTFHKKLRLSEVDELMKAYDKSEIPKNKLERVMVDGLKFITESQKKFLDYGKETHLFPVIHDPSYRMFISGLSGSGKSTFICNFLKYNPPKKGSNVYLFSPVRDDPSLKSVKKLIQINIKDFEADVGREIEVDDFTEGSIAIFDDVETFKKGVKEPYLELRDALLERGRHVGCSTITVSHNPCGGNLTKASLRESQYFLLFPSTNKMDANKVLKNYCGFSSNEINQILAQKSRWAFIKKSIPRYCICEHSVLSF